MTVDGTIIPKEEVKPGTPLMTRRKKFKIIGKSYYKKNLNKDNLLGDVVVVSFVLLKKTTSIFYQFFFVKKQLYFFE